MSEQVEALAAALNAQLLSNHGWLSAEADWQFHQHGWLTAAGRNDALAARAQDLLASLTAAGWSLVRTEEVRHLCSLLGHECGDNCVVCVQSLAGPIHPCSRCGERLS